jgi:hypothetical protein
MSADEIERRNFSIMVWTMDLIDDQAPTTDEADQLIALAASYGPPRTTTTD